MSMGNFPGSLSRRILVGVILLGRLGVADLWRTVRDGNLYVHTSHQILMYREGNLQKVLGKKYQREAETKQEGHNRTKRNNYFLDICKTK